MSGRQGMPNATGQQRAPGSNTSTQSRYTQTLPPHPASAESWQPRPPPVSNFAIPRQQQRASQEQHRLPTPESQTGQPPSSSIPPHLQRPNIGLWTGNIFNAASAEQRTLAKRRAGARYHQHSPEENRRLLPEAMARFGFTNPPRNVEAADEVVKRYFFGRELFLILVADLQAQNIRNRAEQARLSIPRADSPQHDEQLTPRNKSPAATWPQTTGLIPNDPRHPGKIPTSVARVPQDPDDVDFRFDPFHLDFLAHQGFTNLPHPEVFTRLDSPASRAKAILRANPEVRVSAPLFIILLQDCGYEAGRAVDLSVEFSIVIQDFSEKGDGGAREGKYYLAYYGQAGKEFAWRNTE